MIPKFRAYDSGSLSRMYQPDEVMVGDGNIWIIDEDSVAGDWIVNNDLNLMQSTGLFDKKGVEIFEGDILARNGRETLSIVRRGILYSNLCFYIEEEYNGVKSFEPFNPHLPHFYTIVGNIYENAEMVREVK